MFADLVVVDREELRRDDGAYGTAHWYAMRYGVSYRITDRYVRVAHALERLLRIAGALEDGTLSVDMVVELARFATPETERDLIACAARTAIGLARRGGSSACRRATGRRPRRRLLRDDRR
jgi:hypothetical protein